MEHIYGMRIIKAWTITFGGRLRLNKDGDSRPYQFIEAIIKVAKTFLLTAIVRFYQFRLARFANGKRRNSRSYR